HLQLCIIYSFDSTKDPNGGNNTDPKTVRWNLLNNVHRKGLYDNYSELIWIRNSNTDLFDEAASFENNCGDANWTNGRTMVSKAGEKELITVINPNIDKEITVKVTFGKSGEDSYQILSKSYNSEPSFSVAEGTVTVPANCYVTIGTKDVSSAVEAVEISESETLRVYGSNGVITVDYAEAPVTIYSIDGRKVASLSGAGRAEVGRGIFIVVSGRNQRKISL
ncbi:MAG: hypothetical protein K2K95_01095, partial [Muribaculaceae bacterium]|nr:hypothetical protein [Muribaculaceae bacterium]